MSRAMPWAFTYQPLGLTRGLSKKVQTLEAICKDSHPADKFLMQDDKIGLIRIGRQLLQANFADMAVEFHLNFF